VLQDVKLVLHGTGLEINQMSISNQIDNGVLYSSSRSELLGNELSSWIPTDSAVRYYTVIQSLI